MHVLSLHTEVRLGNISFPNNGLIPSEHLVIGSQVHCLSSESHCCQLFPHLPSQALSGQAPSGIGSWRYPNGSYVRLGLAGDSYGITRQVGQVVLHPQGSHMVEGLWRCEIPDEDGVKVISTFNVGFYAQGGGKNVARYYY